MAIDSLAPATTTRSAPTNAFSALNSEEFVRIMFAELANQDPLKPNDSNQMIQQMANLRSIQSDIDLTAKLKALVTENQLASAGNLIGTHISGLTDANNRVEGLVVSINRTADGPVLNLHTGERVQLRNVDEIVDLRLLEPTDDPTDGTDPGTGPQPGDPAREPPARTGNPRPITPTPTEDRDRPTESGDAGGVPRD